MYMHWWWNGGWSWWTWAAMTIGMLTFWALVAWAFVSMIVSPERDRSHPEVYRTPEQVLEDRLATGEIDSDEYRRRLDALRSNKLTTR